MASCLLHCLLGFHCGPESTRCLQVSLTLYTLSFSSELAGCVRVRRRLPLLLSLLLSTAAVDSAAAAAESVSEPPPVVLSESRYLSALSSIIARDYFPAVSTVEAAGHSSDASDASASASASASSLSLSSFTASFNSADNFAFSLSEASRTQRAQRAQRVRTAGTTERAHSAKRRRLHSALKEDDTAAGRLLLLPPAAGSTVKQPATGVPRIHQVSQPASQSAAQQH